MTYFNIVGTLDEDIDQFKIIESGNEMTADRCLNNVGGKLTFPVLSLLLILFIIFLIFFFIRV